MSHFFKTELGQNALQQRNIALTARQRRLLLLIDHEDFKELEPNYKERIAPSELVQQLIDMGLLAQQTASASNISPSVEESRHQTVAKVESPTSIETKIETITMPVAAPTFEPKVDAIPVLSETVEVVEAPIEKLAFVEIQQIMIQTLTTYCGLMARPLVQKIQSIKSLQQLKACQMQWITSLQESRIPPMQLNQTLKQINFSVQQL
ncbi:MAG TPA: hypothetical protein PLU69_07505 [Acinetobacter sp.]|nr:hypothetical protein [Acinetobacter sp.]